MKYETVAETDDFVIAASESGSHILIKKANKASCFLTPKDVTILFNYIDIADLDNFNTVANQFKLIDPFYEKASS